MYCPKYSLTSRLREVSLGHLCSAKFTTIDMTIALFCLGHKNVFSSLYLDLMEIESLCLGCSVSEPECGKVIFLDDTF